jgi:uncharacterized protein YigE (DUF2233 family)
MDPERDRSNYYHMRIEGNGWRWQPGLFAVGSRDMKLLVALFVFGWMSASYGEEVVFKPLLKDGVNYQIFEVSPKQVRILWKDDNGSQLRKFAVAESYLKSRGETPLMLMNGGIFEPECIPTGLMIQNGKELHPINLKNAKGNFFLKPNGVFLISGHEAKVVASEDYKPDPKITYAVQSGPLLLKDGKTHPEFREKSMSRLHRNGVGVTEKGTVILAITERFGQGKFPNFYEFADLFRSLGCQNALFLDGDISLMRVGKEMKDDSNHFSSIIAVVAAPAAESE